MSASHCSLTASGVLGWFHELKLGIAVTYRFVNYEIAGLDEADVAGYGTVVPESDQRGRCELSPLLEYQTESTS